MPDATPPLLDMTLLATYEERLRGLGVPVDLWGAPGLANNEIEESLAPLELILPIEGRVWFGWHNGGVGEGADFLLGPYGERFLTLEKAVDTYHEFREIAQSLVEPGVAGLDDPHTRWHPAWFPLVGPQKPVVIDCSVAEGDPTPVRIVDLADVEGSPQPRAPSMGQMVAWWIRAIDGGAWSWDRTHGRWQTHRERLGADWRRGPLL
jgi:hypothetical protein